MRQKLLQGESRGASTARRPSSTSPAPERVVTKATFVRRMHCAVPESGWRSFFGGETFRFLHCSLPTCRALRSLSCQCLSFRTLTVKFSDHLGLHCEALHLHSVFRMLEHLNSLKQATNLCSEPAADRRYILTCGHVPLVVPRCHGRSHRSEQSKCWVKTPKRGEKREEKKRKKEKKKKGERIENREEKERRRERETERRRREKREGESEKEKR